MKISRIPAGMLATNCYILMDEKTKETAVIDPGGDEDIITAAIEQVGAKVKYVLLTHGHFDHTGAVMSLKNKYNVPVFISKKDYDMILSEVSELYYIQDIDESKINFIEEGTVFNLGENKIICIETPGHTPGGICFAFEDKIISGDTLFFRSVGRTDFEGGDHGTLIDSIKSKLLCLPEETIVYPGHGGETTIGAEKRLNPYLR